MRVYLEDARTEQVENDLLPFETGAIDVLREISDGRPGILLSRARELYNAAAENALPTISGKFARKYFEGQGAPVDSDERGDAADSMEDIDDLLLGRR
jgi:hypothetical protein